MATAAEKEVLGLAATATDAEVMTRIVALTSPKTNGLDSSAVREALKLAPSATNEQVLARINELADGEDSGGHRIALLSNTGHPRPCRTYMVPNTHAIILDLAGVDPLDLAAFEADPRILKVRSNAPVTPKHDVHRLTLA